MAKGIEVDAKVEGRALSQNLATDFVLSVRLNLFCMMDVRLFPVSKDYVGCQGLGSRTASTAAVGGVFIKTRLDLCTKYYTGRKTRK